ncbi:TraR/DksA C4-type zinc finger protein [Neisseriaceae bacterium TC5R-5]|nr:TraR/DksA C4-type zinc finger protein [Neisseriaceae bacterium TC5R-5]
MDIFDQAQALEAFQRELAIAATHQLSLGESLAECEDCGGQIPPARRAAVRGCTRCVYCQEHQERRQRGLA